MCRGISVLAVCAALAAAPARADVAGEAAASALFDEVVQSPQWLRIFLHEMPKGGDLHNHLGGSDYAEDFAAWAAADGYCVSADGKALVEPPCPGGRPARDLIDSDPLAFDRLIDGLSTRGWQKGVGADGVSGHNQFFATFDRFGAIASAHVPDDLVSTLRLAAGDRASYVELMHDPGPIMAHVFAAADGPLDEASLAARYDSEIKAVAPVIAAARAEMDRDEAATRRLLGCGGKQADPACGVTVRYLAWGLRDQSPTRVFRSLILSFALADADPRFVGVNIVEPEDWPVALSDYRLHMAMFRFLEAKYPHVQRSLHAGELAFGRVPPAALADHIRQAVDAGAERIGHGTAIAYEEDAPATLARMAAKGIAVEINLTSNAVILGVKGADHPLNLYRRMGVPVVLSTDDEGVLRTDLTNEYVRAASEQGLRYADLKQIARASLAYSFLPGASLWREHRIGSAVEPCAHSLADAPCRRFVAASEKARLEADLEARFDRFEHMDVAALDTARNTGFHAAGM